MVRHESRGLERRAERRGEGGALRGEGAEPQLDGLALEGASVVGGNGVFHERELDGAAEVRVLVLHGLLCGAAQLGAPEADAVDGAERARELVAEALELRVVEGACGAGLEAAQLEAEEGAVLGGAAELGELLAELPAQGGVDGGAPVAEGGLDLLGLGELGLVGGRLFRRGCLLGSLLGSQGAGLGLRGLGLRDSDCVALLRGAVLAADVREAPHEREQVSSREGGEDAALSLERTDLAAAVGVDGVIEAVVVVAAAGGEEVEGPLPLLEGVAAARTAAALGREGRRGVLVLLLCLHCAGGVSGCWGKGVKRAQQHRNTHT